MLERSLGCLVPAKMAGDQEQFQQLLTGLLSVDNKIRQQAEVSAINKPQADHLSEKFVGNKTGVGQKAREKRGDGDYIVQRGLKEDRGAIGVISLPLFFLSSSTPVFSRAARTRKGKPETGESKNLAEIACQDRNR